MAIQRPDISKFKKPTTGNNSQKQKKEPEPDLGKGGMGAFALEAAKAYGPKFLSTLSLKIKLIVAAVILFLLAAIGSFFYFVIGVKYSLIIWGCLFLYMLTVTVIKKIKSKKKKK